jgi:nitroreductase
VPSQEELKKIVGAGILAPSGDNSQPWQLYYDGEKLHVVNLPERDTSLYNVGDIASFIAFGAMAENMAIAAQSLGYAIDISLLPKGATVPFVASMSFTKGETIRDPLLPYIPQRCVNRKPYKRKPLSRSVIDSLLKAAGERKDAKLCLIDQGEEKNIMAKNLALNDRIVFENEKLHSFLFTHIRWSRDEIETSRDGLSIGSLELGAFQSKMMKVLASWKVVQFLNRFGFSRFVPDQAYQLCKGSSALCILSHTGTGLDSYFHGGRVLQRIWLTATSVGLSLHPMTGLVYLIHSVRSGHKGLSDNHKKLLFKSFESLKKLCPLGENESYIMAFRIGYADPPSDKSIRLPLEKVLTFDSPPN